MTNDYDYIAVSTDSELITAYTKVMSDSTDQNLKLQMAEASQVSYDKLVSMMKQICNGNTKIKSLVNNQIEETRTAESIERQRKRQESEMETLKYYTIPPNSAKFNLLAFKSIENDLKQ